jgi:hypothetical protein
MLTPVTFTAVWLLAVLANVKLGGLVHVLLLAALAAALARRAARRRTV